MDIDTIMERIGMELNACFDYVESVPGAVYIQDGTKTYVLTCYECEQQGNSES